MSRTIRIILIALAALLAAWIVLFLLVVLITSSGGAAGAGLTGLQRDAARAQHDPGLARRMLRTYAGRMALAPYITGRPAQMTAHAAATTAAACHGDVGSGWIWNTGPVHTGSIWIHDRGWCQSGDRIYRDFGTYTQTWHGTGFCLVSVQSEWGWDFYPRWKHGYIRGTLGLLTPWQSCVGFNTGAAYLRISGWWRGGRVWWDRVKDF